MLNSITAPERRQRAAGRPLRRVKCTHDHGRRSFWFITLNLRSAALAREHEIPWTVICPSLQNAVGWVRAKSGVTCPGHVRAAKPDDEAWAATVVPPITGIETTTRRRASRAPARRRDMPGACPELPGECNHTKVWSFTGANAVTVRQEPQPEGRHVPKRHSDRSLGRSHTCGLCRRRALAGFACWCPDVGARAERCCGAQLRVVQPAAPGHHLPLVAHQGARRLMCGRAKHPAGVVRR